MSEDPDRSARPAAPDVERRGRRRGVVSAVWLVPFVAIIIAVAIAWQSWQDRGVLIEIVFPDASGVTAGQTTLRYREVSVGVVEDIGFTADLREVIAYVRVNAEIAPYLDESASFWIVQPEVTARGVEGLNTILSGTYIQGTWDNEVGDPQTTFIGADRAPIVPPGVEGTAIVLRAQDSSRLGPGAPILYRGIEVGEVADPRLTVDGTEVRVDAFVRAPYDRQLSTSTRFWDASGVSASLGASGVDLRIGSVASILEGGVNFDTLISGGAPVQAGYIYNIYDDLESARASVFAAPDGRSITMGALFPAAISGLTEGAPVRFQGVRVGTVTAVTGFIRPDEPTGEVQLLAVMSLLPAKMGLPNMGNNLEGIDFIDDLVAEGLRARLVSTSILGGDLAIDLIDVPEAAPGQALEIGIAANPIIPSIETDVEGLAASAENVLTRINDLPIEELLASATDLLDNVNRIAADDATRAIPSEVMALLSDGQGLVRDGRNILSSPQVAGVLTDIEAATGDLRAITADVAGRQLAATLDSALNAATAAAENIAAGTEGLDALAASTQRVLDGVEGVVASEDTQALPGEAVELIREGRALVADPAIETILADLAAVSTDIRAITRQLTEADAAARLTAALDAAAEAATSVAGATEELPALTDSAERVLAEAEVLAQRLSALAATANDLPLNDLVTSTTDLMRTADLFLSSDEAGDVPVVLSETLQELRLTIETIRTGGTLENLNTTLSSAAEAADSIRTAATDLPELVERLQTVAGNAGTLLDTYSAGSRVNTELYSALRAAVRAAEDVSSLARTIERNPNSLLLGR
ncbi:Paraquat-inducible protein B [Jannaschia seosinensis]|uniref:Paraquat-inducible protein B n=1 Tax=Jannaschia seosinensis TaxID=313367 RepID=A0A0M7BCK3_9RHOB|nr:MlaD family protein [Jannaschia seosinensis]CUH39554.1 Paraquat-inducible protein B [Jannaschia seosinensis]